VPFCLDAFEQQIDEMSRFGRWEKSRNHPQKSAVEYLKGRWREPGDFGDEQAIPRVMVVTESLHAIGRQFVYRNVSAFERIEVCG
jgi:hypothetical protein